MFLYICDDDHGCCLRVILEEIGCSGKGVYWVTLLSTLSRPLADMEEQRNFFRRNILLSARIIVASNSNNNR